MRPPIKNERGQAIVLTVIALTMVLGMAALAVDVGSWFREDRRAQATADAAALAGAQVLAFNGTGAARALALDYADRNGGGVEEDDVTFESQLGPGDTIVVQAKRTTPGFFAKIFGIDSVDVHAKAKARVAVPSSARYVAPIAVNRFHPMLSCEPPPCTDLTEIELADLHKPGGGDAAGDFSLLDLRQGGDGTVGESEAADWMTDGYDELMPLGIYDAIPSAMFNGDQFQDALASVLGKEILLPVYLPPVVRSGSTADFNIVAWVGFVPTQVVGRGAAARIRGHFTTFIAQGVQGSGGSEDLGVRTIQLVE